MLERTVRKELIMKKIIVIVTRKHLNSLETKDHETHYIINDDKSNCDTSVNNDAVESNRCQPNYCNHKIFEKFHVIPGIYKSHIFNFTLLTLKFSNPVNIVWGHMQLFCVAYDFFLIIIHLPTMLTFSFQSQFIQCYIFMWPFKPVSSLAL